MVQNIFLALLVLWSFLGVAFSDHIFFDCFGLNPKLLERPSGMLWAVAALFTCGPLAWVIFILAVVGSMIFALVHRKK